MVSPRALARQARHQRDPGLALVQHQHWAGALADHQVGFPVSHRRARVSVVRSLRNVGFLGDRVTGCPSVALAATGVVAGQEAPEPPRLLTGAVDPAVDRLQADRPQPGLDPEPQPSGDLLRRPALGQAVRYIGRKRRVPFEHARPLAAQHVRAVRPMRPVGAAVERVAPQLARDGRSSPAERPGDRPKRQAISLQSRQPIPFIGGEVGII